VRVESGVSGVRCRLAHGNWCHCHSLSLASVKSRLVLPFWYRLTRVVPYKGPLNGCKYVSSFLRQLRAGSWRGCCRPQSIDISFQPGPQQQTRRGGGRAGQTDWQTERRTDGQGRTPNSYTDPAPFIYLQNTRCSTHAYHSRRQKFCCRRTACAEQFIGYSTTDHQLRTV